MTPALEYFIRSDAAKEYLSVPCSLFLLSQQGEKLVVVVAEEAKQGDTFKIKHWHLSSCQSDQALPSMTEFVIPKSEIFSSEHVVVKDHMLFRYLGERVASSANNYDKPMSRELYEYWFDHLIYSPQHNRRRLDWLWEEFARIYVPQLSCSAGYISGRSASQIAEDQRKLVSEHLPRFWHIWLKWCGYMLDFKGVAPELVFAKEFDSV